MKNDFAVTRALLAVLSVAFGLGLAACRGATEPQIMHWYGNTPYTTGVYEDPSWYSAPDAK
jgi:hypothetical protein